MSAFMSDTSDTARLEKTFDPSTMESQLYALWEEQGCFKGWARA